MTEYQKVATGLLGLTHPEVFLPVRNKAGNPPQPASSTAAKSQLDSRSELDSTSVGAPDPSTRQTGALLRSVKFAFAALMAGSRAVPLGDNGGLTRGLVAYAERLRH